MILVWLGWLGVAAVAAIVIAYAVLVWRHRHDPPGDNLWVSDAELREVRRRAERRRETRATRT